MHAKVIETTQGRFAIQAREQLILVCIDNEVFAFNKEEAQMIVAAINEALQNVE